MFGPIFGVPTFKALSSWDELNRIRRQMDRIMDLFDQRSGVGLSAGVFPAVNLTENDDAFFVRAELPGLTTNDLQIQATTNSITIAGEHQLRKEDGSARYHRREREGGKFSRMLSLPKEIDAERIEARIADGILTLKIPKSEAAKPRRIQISG